MAKQVIWSLRAQQDKREILNYWRQRNKSNAYSKKLNELFKEAVKIITDFPQIGRVTDDATARLSDYLRGNGDEHLHFNYLGQSAKSGRP